MLPADGERRDLRTVHVQPLRRPSKVAARCVQVARGNGGRGVEDSHRSDRHLRLGPVAVGARVEAVHEVAGPLLDDHCAEVVDRVGPNPGLDRHPVRQVERVRVGNGTKAFVPLNESALPNRPAVAPAQVAFEIVPLLPFRTGRRQTCRSRRRTRTRRRDRRAARRPPSRRPPATGHRDFRQRLPRRPCRSTSRRRHCQCRRARRLGDPVRVPGMKPATVERCTL